MHIDQLFVESPVGLLVISSTARGICKVSFVDEKPTAENVQSDLNIRCRDQLNAYFRGHLRQFDLPMDLQGTGFQIKVWKALKHIKYGQTVSYTQLARSLGDIKAVRAVGHANGKNPIAIIVPCHRVIGSTGKLVGYAGGLDRKAWLLRHEGSWNQLSIFK